MRDLEEILLLPEIISNIPNLSSSYLNYGLNITQRLPSIPGYSVEEYFSNEQDELYDYYLAMGLAYEEARQLDILMRAKARAENRLAQKIAEGRI